MNNLAKALYCFVADNNTAEKLSGIMEYAFTTGKIDYEQAGETAGQDAEDALLAGWEWRLLIPVRTSRCGEWDDRILMLEPGEQYEMPNIVSFLVREAVSSGKWDTRLALEKYFRECCEPEWHKIPDLVVRIRELCSNHIIDSLRIRGACDAVGLVGRADTMIAILKGAGVISPKLGSLALVSKVGMPLYEFNPSLFAEMTAEVKNGRGTAQPI